MTRLTPKMQIVWEVLDAAKANGNGDAFFVATCRRLIVADRLGWKKHHASLDWKLVRDMYESMNEVAV
jgi:hypothetical protein